MHRKWPEAWVIATCNRTWRGIPQSLFLAFGRHCDSLGGRRWVWRAEQWSLRIFLGLRSIITSLCCKYARMPFVVLPRRLFMGQERSIVVTCEKVNSWPKNETWKWDSTAPSDSILSRSLSTHSAKLPSLSLRSYVSGCFKKRSLRWWWDFQATKCVKNGQKLKQSYFHFVRYYVGLLRRVVLNHFISCGINTHRHTHTHARTHARTHTPLSLSLSLFVLSYNVTDLEPHF